MAVLSDADRAAIVADFMRAFGENSEVSTGYLKAELRAAVDAADLWADTNAASYNLALPLPFRSAATASQKARLLLEVIRRRWLTGA